jgi:hypothetical protein
VGEDRRAVGVEADGEVVGHEGADTFLDRADPVTVGDDLVDRDHDDRLDASSLGAILRPGDRDTALTSGPC